MFEINGCEGNEFRGTAFLSSAWLSALCVLCDFILYVCLDDDSLVWGDGVVASRFMCDSLGTTVI